MVDRCDALSGRDFGDRRPRAGHRQSGYICVRSSESPTLDPRVSCYWFVRESVATRRRSAQRVRRATHPRSTLRHLGESADRRCRRSTSSRRIADFLDAETARIDALIEKKRRMIELLEERSMQHRRVELESCRRADVRSDAPCRAIVGHCASRRSSSSSTLGEWSCCDEAHPRLAGRLTIPWITTDDVGRSRLTAPRCSTDARRRSRARAGELVGEVRSGGTVGVVLQWSPGRRLNGLSTCQRRPLRPAFGPLPRDGPDSRHLRCDEAASADSTVRHSKIASHIAESSIASGSAAAMGEQDAIVASSLSSEHVDDRLGERIATPDRSSA